MTSASISNVLPISNVSEGKTSSASDMSDLKNKSSFASVINNINIDNLQKHSVPSASKDEYQQYKYKDNNITEAEKSPVLQKIEESKEDIEASGREIVSEIAEELDVSEEDVIKAMQELGMIVFDLLSPQNLAGLVEKINPDKDLTNLILDADFKQLLSDVNQIGAELMEELEMNPSEFDEMIGQMDRVEDTVEQQAILSYISEEIELKNENVKEDNIRTNDVENVIESVSDDESIEVQMKTTGNEFGSETSDSEGEFDDRTQLSKEDNVKGAEGSELNNFVSTSKNEAVEVIKNTDSYSSHVDTKDIMGQIVQKVSVEMTGEETSMELQLNPESLGKVYINISSKNGEVSANIITMNEMVREALETQMVNLRENLNQAGVKVDAIEVTVSSHGFERNLEQDTSRDEREGERQEMMSSQRRRNINLSSLDELSGVMDEEEALVAQMMKDNGNTMDMMA